MATLTLPDLAEREVIRHDDDIMSPYIVILYNCDCHSFGEVIMQLQKAAGHSLEKAEMIAMEAHTRGRAIAYSGDQEECERVAAVLRSIRLQVETDRS